MGRVATGLVLCLVAAVLAVAVLDSLRGGNDEADPPAPARTDDAERADVESRLAIANRLRHEGIGGRLLYTDERCALRAVTLPDLEPAATPGFRGLGCAFSTSPDGERVATPGAAWSPDSRRVAVCRGRSVVVSVASERAPEVERHEGCKPAWRPDGVLTLVRGGEVVDNDGTTLVSRRAIRMAVALDQELAIAVEDVAWLTPRRAALLLGITTGSGVREWFVRVAIFEEGRVVRFEDLPGPAGTRLDVGAGMLAVRPVFLLDSRGRWFYPKPLEGTGGAEAVAISPGGRWVAVALPGRVTLLRVDELRAGRFRSVTLPFAARDLAWR